MKRDRDLISKAAEGTVGKCSTEIKRMQLYQFKVNAREGEN